MSSHTVPFKTYFSAFLALLVLLGLTTGLAYLHMGSFSTVITLVFAFVEMLLVLLFFTQLRQGSGLMRAIVVAGFFWLAILICLTYTDYSTRAWIQAPQAWSSSSPATHP